MFLNREKEHYSDDRSKDLFFFIFMLTKKKTKTNPYSLKTSHNKYLIGCDFREMLREVTANSNGHLLCCLPYDILCSPQYKECRNGNNETLRVSDKASVN